MEPHDITMVVLGAAILWFGWFGFNAGSALGATGQAAYAFVNTAVAAAVAGLTWTLVARQFSGKPRVVGAASGVVAGLVAVTPAAGYVMPMEAMAIGAVAGVICYGAVRLRAKIGFDDSLDVVGVHGVGGVWGGIATGLFASAAVGGVNGAFHGAPDQLWRQAAAIGVVALYSFVVTFGILKLLDVTMGLRVSEEEEIAGLDVSQHGERAYIFGGSGPVLGIPEAIPVHMHGAEPGTAAEHALQPSHGGAQ
jgi:Amt family ammonium transporter